MIYTSNNCARKLLIMAADNETNVKFIDWTFKYKNCNDEETLLLHSKMYKFLMRNPQKAVICFEEPGILLFKFELYDVPRTHALCFFGNDFRSVDRNLDIAGQVRSITRLVRPATCPICLDECVEILGDICITDLPCGHTGHLKCYANWAKSSNMGGYFNCPECKKLTKF